MFSCCEFDQTTKAIIDLKIHQLSHSANKYFTANIIKNLNANVRRKNHSIVKKINRLFRFQ